MCFTEHKDNSKFKIAKEDIICYKVVLKEPEGKTAIPYYKHNPGFEYTRGEITPLIKLRRVGISRKGQRSFHVFAGYHSFLFEDTCKALYYLGQKDFQGRITKLAKFAIPAGTKYLESSITYVSERIKFVHFMNKS